MWKTVKGLQNKTNVKKKTQLKVAGNLVEFSLALVLGLLSWGAVLKAAPLS